MLQRRGRLTYGALKRQFPLDNGYLEGLKNELIEVQRLAADEDGRVLVWTGGADVLSPAPARAPQPALSQAESAPSTPPPPDAERRQLTVLFCDLLGLDAGCHIPRRATLLQRCAAWLHPGWRIAFYDHIECQLLPETQRQLFYALWYFPGLETLQSSVAAIEAAGLPVCFHEETSASAVRFYTCLLTGYCGAASSFRDRPWPGVLPTRARARADDTALATLGS